MQGIAVERVIPAEYLEGIKRGIYEVHGGVIRSAYGTKPIVAHLQFADPRVMESLGPPFKPLLNATMALSALNLAVTTAGFAVVCKKLKEISRKLDNIETHLQEVKAVLMELGWAQEAQCRAMVLANLENLARGVRIGSKELTHDALARLTESAEFYRLSAERLVSNVRQVYFEPRPVRDILENVYAQRLAQAHAFALEGHPREASHVVEDLLGWQREYQDKLEAPLNKKPAPIWLGQLSTEQRTNFKEFKKWHTQLSVGLEYASNQYQLCVDHGIHPGELAELTKEEPMAVLLVEDSRPARS